MKNFVSKNGLSRELGLAPQTLDNRLIKTGTEPDGIVIRPGSQSPQWLFDLDNLPALRSRLLTQPLEVQL